MRVFSGSRGNSIAFALCEGKSAPSRPSGSDPESNPHGGTTGVEAKPEVGAVSTHFFPLEESVELVVRIVTWE